MADIVALGTSKFVLGFQLAGIKETIVVKDAASDFNKFMSRKDVGIILTDDKTIKQLGERERTNIESSVNPVVVVLSTEDYSEGLRQMIKNSIGVDVYGKE
jgi:vacuolar-type H+-ATPase subunit F/Vma7